MSVYCDNIVAEKTKAGDEVLKIISAQCTRVCPGLEITDPDIEILEPRCPLINEREKISSPVCFGYGKVMLNKSLSVGVAAMFLILPKLNIKKR